MRVNREFVAETTVASLPQTFTMFKATESALKPDPEIVNVYPPAYEEMSVPPTVKLEETGKSIVTVLKVEVLNEA